MYDQLLDDIAEYVSVFEIKSESAWAHAHLSLLDSMGCAVLALQNPDCHRFIQPLTKEQVAPGVPVMGAKQSMPLLEAASKWGALIRWLDYNDTWLAKEWAHPSDNLGALLPICYYINQHQLSSKPITLKTMMEMLIKAYEIQGVLAIDNAFNASGLDHVILVKAASCAVVTKLLGGNQQAIKNALSQVWVDGQSLRTYRHAPNTGLRKSWAAGDAASRAIFLALLTMQGEPGYHTPLSSERWGFEDVYREGRSVTHSQPFTSYVMENILYKVSFPAEFHAQTAAEVAIKLHEQVKHRLDEIKSIDIYTQEPADRIINKQGPLNNPADRDHCLQYIVAVALLNGKLEYKHYADEYAESHNILDTLRDKMHITVESDYTEDYYDLSKRSISNAIQITFTDGSTTERVSCEYPIGHQARREEAKPLLLEKCRKNLATFFDKNHVDTIMALWQDQDKLGNLPVDKFLALFCQNA